MLHVGFFRHQVFDQQTKRISYCIKLYHIKSYYIISYHIVFYFILLYYIVCYLIILYFILSYNIILYHIISKSYRNCIISYHIISNCIALECIYYILLYYISYCTISYHIISLYLTISYLYIIILLFISFYYEMILYDTVYCQISLQIRPLDLRSRLMQHCDTESTFSFRSFMKRMNFLSGRNFYRISNAQINPRFSNSFSVRWNEALVIEAWIYRWLTSTGHD